MCMKNRLCRMGRTLVGAICLLSTCGLTFSCSDDYDLPDTTPSWLGSSIYGYLESKGNYKNVTNLIDDLNLKDVFSKTKSMTLFVADDEAYAKFYANNRWGVKSYQELSTSQKKLLLYSSMLDNPYLLEMLPNSGTSGSGVVKDVCLRQTASSSVTDSIPCVSWSNMSFWPITYNKTEDDYWTRFRLQDRLQTYVAQDGTQTYMLHFINSQMAEAKVTDADFEMFAGTKRNANDAFIYGSKVVGQDITCQNGYIHQLDRVLLTPDNMAEVIRTNGRTSLFSHLLDRFSVPVYNASLTSQYKSVVGDKVDSVFQKRYINNSKEYKLDKDPNGNDLSFFLRYDPGWNSYTSSSASVEKDMAAMLVPSDEALIPYFLTGGGTFLMDVYADKEAYAKIKDQDPSTIDKTELFKVIDAIPLNVIQELINNLMQSSFLESVPSKYLTIMNDAQDQMFNNLASVDAYKSIIDTCLLANNGAVYILNKVYTPAKYASVSAPVLVNENTHIFNWTITADDAYVTNPNSAPLNSFFSAYLLAMSSRFSFFVPTDQALGTYYDPVSFTEGSTPRVIQMSYSKRTGKMTTNWARYNRETGQIGETETSLIKDEVRNNRLSDLMDNHIVVHEDGTSGIENTTNEFFLTKGGSAIRVKRTPKDPTTGSTFEISGGWQIENEKTHSDKEGKPCKVLEVYDKTQSTNGYGNGMTYIIDQPIQTTTKSVYSILNDNESETSPYLDFFDLCQVDPVVLEDANVAPKEIFDTPAKKNAELMKYYIFVSNNGLDYNVRFFNTYRYTVYIPTNAAIKDAIAKGLPTWQSILAYCKAEQAKIEGNAEITPEEEDIATKAYQAKARAMITCLINFIKYHFQDNSLFADKEAVTTSDNRFETACLDTKTNRYLTVGVNRLGNNQMKISDIEGNERNVTDRKNIMARDFQFDNSKVKIMTSSFAVIHQIDGVLNFEKLPNGRYDGFWTTENAAKRFSSRFKLEK